MNLTQQVTWIPVEERLPKEATFQLYHVAFDISGTGELLRLDGHWRQWGKYDDVYEDHCVTHWAEPLRHPSEMIAELEKKRTEEQEDFKKNGRRCGDCGSPVWQCECN